MKRRTRAHSSSSRKSPARSSAARTSPAPELELDEIVLADGLAAGGRAVARLKDGRAVFVPRAFPGDRLHLERGKAHASYVEVVAYDLLEASPERRVAPCPDEGRCGGCDWMPLNLERQRRHKADIVRQSLERVGRVSPERLGPRLPIVFGEGLGYRRRVRLHLEGRRLGFHAEASRTLVEVERCFVCAPELWAAVTRVRELFADEARVRAEWLDGVVEVEVRLLEGAARPAVRLGLRSGARASSELLGRLRELAYVEGDPTPERWELGGGVYTLLPPGGFVQVNSEVNAEILKEVLRIAQSAGARTALDVYSGVGNFSLPLAQVGIQTLGIELAPEATRYAARAAREQALPASFRAGPADRLLGELGARGERFELVVVDPPRSGAKGLAPLLARLCQRTLIMISCDPVTFARDVGALERAGFELARTLVFDMFPQTHHVESLAVLTR